MLVPAKEYNQMPMYMDATCRCGHSNSTGKQCKWHCDGRMHSVCLRLC